MADKVGVVEDGVTTETSRRRSNPGWILAVTGFVMGLGLGVLVVNPSTGESPPATAAPSGGVAAPTTLAPTSVEDDGLIASVPDFPDTLVAVARTTGSTLDHLLWPLEGGLRTSSMAGGRGVRLDAGARFVALSESVPGTEGLLLSMGRSNQIRPVAGNVTSYVWHDEASGLLSYTTEIEGVWRLFVVGSNFSPQLVTESTNWGGHLIGFGHWGWAVQTSSDEMSLLTSEGGLVSSQPGVGYVSHHDGWIFMMDGDPKLVSAGGVVMRIEADLDVGDVYAATFSPDRTKIAVAGEGGWAMADLTSGAVETFPGFPPVSMAWSSDSRFALSAGAAGVVVFDTRGAEAYFVLRRYSMLAVGTAPLNDS